MIHFSYLLSSYIFCLQVIENQDLSKDFAVRSRYGKYAIYINCTLHSLNGQNSQITISSSNNTETNRRFYSGMCCETSEHFLRWFSGFGGISAYFQIICPESNPTRISKSWCMKPGELYTSFFSSKYVTGNKINTWLLNVYDVAEK